MFNRWFTKKNKIFFIRLFLTILFKQIYYKLLYLGIHGNTSFKCVISLFAVFIFKDLYFKYNNNKYQ